MNADIAFEFISVTEFWQGTRSIADVLLTHEIVFAQNIFRTHFDACDIGNKVFLFPVIAFPAFHPDMTYLRGKLRGDDEAHTVTNAMIMYHSRIVLTGYLGGLNADEIIDLFRPENYSKLGYFDCWDAARQELLKEGIDAGLPLGRLFERWTARGCFMHSMNHPRLQVMEDIARQLMVNAGLPISADNVAGYLDDPLRGMSIWPVYPGIAERLNLSGDFSFIKGGLSGVMGLQEFVHSSIAQYEAYERGTLEPLNFQVSDYRERLDLNGAAKAPVSPVARGGNPYRSAEKVQFWKNSVANVPPTQLDPVVNPKFNIGSGERIATAGSCFAQHIARVLAESGFHYLIAEQPPANLTAEEARNQNYGVYSARYGNIYTTRQLLQLIQRVEGSFMPEDNHWLTDHGRYVDPFRPQIQPEGFATVEQVEYSRQQHFSALRTMFETMDVFVFTLGLTEGWRSRIDGAVFPLAPGVAGGRMDASRYEFINFTVQETIADLHAVLDRLSRINPGCRVILTVSPVPLIATYERRHALVATTYSKSVLRTAADAIARTYGHVEYFPSYEIITGSYSRGAYFEEDLRSVSEEGVAHVMRVFMRRYTGGAEAAPDEELAVRSAASKRPVLFDIVCDEEAIANF
jgi:hypothetical protein